MHLLWYFPDGEGGRKTQWSIDWLTPKNRDRPWPWDGEEEEDNAAINDGRFALLKLGPFAFNIDW